MILHLCQQGQVDLRLLSQVKNQIASGVLRILTTDLYAGNPIPRDAQSNCLKFYFSYLS
jgi:hypothetical protein